MLLVDNARQTGSPWTFPIDAWFDRGASEWGQTFPHGCNRLGFGPDRGCHGVQGYGLADAWHGLLLNAAHADRLFLGFRGSLLGPGLDDPGDLGTWRVDQGHQLLRRSLDQAQQFSLEHFQRRQVSQCPNL